MHIAQNTNRMYNSKQGMSVENNNDAGNTANPKVVGKLFTNENEAYRFMMKRQLDPKDPKEMGCLVFEKGDQRIFYITPWVNNKKSGADYPRWSEPRRTNYMGYTLVAYIHTHPTNNGPSGDQRYMNGTEYTKQGDYYFYRNFFKQKVDMYVLSQEYT